jgi:hypothetical protein
MYELAYGLHLIMLIEYLLPTNPQRSKDFSLVWVLATKLFQLEQLDEARDIVATTSGQQLWNQA